MTIIYQVKLFEAPTTKGDKANLSKNKIVHHKQN